MPTRSKMPSMLFHSRSGGLSLAVASLLLISGCTAITNVESDAEERALPVTVQLYLDAVNCLTESAAVYPEGQEILDFAYDLPPCVGRFLLEKSDEEIGETFKGGSTGSWLVEARQEGDLGIFRVLTVGAGGASAGITSYVYEIAVCWTATINTREQTYVGSADDTCDPVLLQPFGNIEVMTLEDLTAAAEHN